VEALNDGAVEEPPWAMAAHSRPKKHVLCAALHQRVLLSLVPPPARPAVSLLDLGAPSHAAPQLLTAPEGTSS
jgi:hypothetical protein